MLPKAGKTFWEHYAIVSNNILFAAKFTSLLGN